MTVTCVCIQRNHIKNLFIEHYSKYGEIERNIMKIINVTGTLQGLRGILGLLGSSFHVIIYF